MYSTSATLLERIREPTDRAAWDRFVKLYTPFLFHCGLRLGLIEAETEDAVQEVFVLLLDKLPAFRYEKNGSFRAWLRTVATNKIRERGRKRREMAEGGSDAAFATAIDPADQDRLWQAEYNQYLAKRALEIMQAEFEPATWKAVWLTTVEDRPISDVAAELGVTKNAISIARCRVLKRLREELAGLLDD